MANMLYGWPNGDKGSGEIWDDGDILFRDTNGNHLTLQTTPDQAERIIDALCRAHGFIWFNYDFWAKHERQDD